MIGEELFLSVGAQALLFFKAVGAGFFIGVLYECFRAPRRLLQFIGPAAAVGDILFFCIAALTAFRFFLAASDGRPRFFLLIGMAFGTAIYFGTIGRVLSRLEGKTVRHINRLRRRFQKATGAAADRVAASGKRAGEHVLLLGKRTAGQLRSYIFFKKKTFFRF